MIENTVDCTGECLVITGDEGKMIRLDVSDLEPISEEEIPSVSKSIERGSFRKIMDNGLGLVKIYDTIHHGRFV